MEQILKIGTNFKNGNNYELEQISKMEQISKIGTNFERNKF
jgi:hypothetical protein